MKKNAEQNWVERARQGEPAAIAELYRHYWRAARATAYGVTGDIGLAEDAASEAFYAALDALQDLKDPQRFSPWLRTIVVRTAGRLKASKSKDNAVELQTLPDAKSQAPSVPLEQREMAALIHEAVANLSQTLREAMSLFYFEGYSLKEAARFLDVPGGTLKRRLHEGRQRLRDAAKRILKGAKPMDAKRKQILQQLTDAADEGPDSEAFYQAMRQAFRLRPMPRDRLVKIWRRHMAARQGATSMPPEEKRFVREWMDRIYGPSERARDPNHPVGAAAQAIRAALPEFQEWHVDMSKVDLSQIKRQMFEGKEQAFSFALPPGFAEGSSGSHVSARQAWLVQDEDGSVRTTYELMQAKATRDALTAQMKKGSRLSDALYLLWKRPEALELREVEEQLRRLAELITPDTPARFCPFEEPHYRAALRMQLGDNPIPAAIGGVMNPLSGMPDRVDIAAVIIHLEPWASAQSGQIIELAEFPAFHSKDRGSQ
ncbi:MAG: sigma-70 family RNA polymerase sigma factor [Phycisphaerales bacterium]|nr:MAG: sigma-70 family RNA polymerase sigma factor [Phycisphaerales bacterium]